MKPLFTQYAKNMIQKERTIEKKISILCDLMDIKEDTIQGKIKQLKRHEDALQFEK